MSGGIQKRKIYRNKNNKYSKKFRRTRNAKKDEDEEEMESIPALYKDLTKKDKSSFQFFTDFPLSSRTRNGLEECGYVEPTDIQRESLPFSLSGSDIVGAAKTGSGKTLAIIIPLLECLWRSGWSNYCGLGAVIICPTRELALQTFTVINDVGKYHDFSCALLIGGTDVDYERSRIGRVNIIICTPGRLLQHMDENEHFSCDQLQLLILDEADRILDMGFSQQVNAIVANLPRDRQTLLFSATQTRNVRDLSRVCTKDPIFISVHERSVHATPDFLKQAYVVCEDHDKVNLMWSYIISRRKFKTIIFVSSCKQARFLTGTFCHLRPGLPIMGLWGTMNQKKRVDVFQKFENKEAAVMIATDVASRGLDFSSVDWVIQVDCPATVEDYIHRVGRTARMNRAGHAVLFLTPSQEEEMILALKKVNIPLVKQMVDAKSIVNIRLKMQATLSQFPQLNQFAQKSVVAYLRSIYMMRNKKVFNVRSINVSALASSYGLVTVPRVRFLNKKCVKVHDAMEVADENDNVLELKRKDVFNSFGDKSETINELADRSELITNGPTNAKVVTKLTAAKKLLRKNIKVNVRKVFDEEGELIKVDNASVGHENVGLDIASAAESIKKSSTEDRARYKALMKQRKNIEKHLKQVRSNRGVDLEESGSIDGETDLSFLPDPDEVREKYKNREPPESDDEEQNSQLSVLQEPSSVTSVAFCPQKPYNVASTSSVRLSLYDTVICEPISMFSRRLQVQTSCIWCKVPTRREIDRFDFARLVERKVNYEYLTLLSLVAPLRTIRASQGSVHCVEFTICGRMMYSMAADGSVKQSKPIIEFAAHNDAIRGSAVSTTNSNMLLTGGYDHVVRFSTPLHVHYLYRIRNSSRPSCSPVESVLFLNGEHLVATAAGSVVKVWDIAAGGRMLMSLQQHHKTVTSICLGNNGDVLLSGGIDRRINVVRLMDFALLHSMSMAAPVLGLAMSPDDRTMVVGMGQLLAIHRREPKPKEIVAADIIDKRSMVRTAAPKVRVEEAGKSKQYVEISAKSVDQHKLSKVDFLLKGYQHAAAIRKMFQSYYFHFKKEEVIAWLRVIIQRGAINRAISGQPNEVLVNMLK
ncbi:DEAD/DEAH box helicase [Dictyocaulus viviparus]|uniref:ATP-dependent RNA helicase n=1 Tax=Dictyocaulus viviparus TaxID=29172 RepID=A0A0D8X9R4_DICVI|nr:DEAD/DEAH box helicase [Dictyocaulus viviparus]